METVDEVWFGDLFDRRKEAEDLVGYLENVAGRPPIREDGHANVMAVDTAYGHGKTFFLRRLNRHLKSTDHVSAYVDAWTDDLEDQPMVALAATLDHALQPWAEKSEPVAERLAEFKNKAGRVAKIVGVGLAKRGAGFLITQGAAEALSDELAKVTEKSRDAAADALKDGADTIVEGLSAVEPVTTPSMEARIKRFREGQAAIAAMKDSLSQVVRVLVGAGMKLPITIIVDELDRCRPTYAIKVLEEIKHLFDVPGVAFLLGLHGKQLEHSVTAAYGHGFDGAAYLRRFFNRRYTLKPVSLRPLTANLLRVLAINESSINHPSVVHPGYQKPINLPIADLIADYIIAYGLAARDAFGIVEGLHTALALVGRKQVQLSYLLPLIISHHMGEDDMQVPVKAPPWAIAIATDRFGRDIQEHSLISFVVRLQAAAQMSDTQLSEGINNNDIFARIVSEGGFKNSSEDYHLLQNYPALVRAVARFS